MVLIEATRKDGVLHPPDLVGLTFADPTNNITGQRSVWVSEELNFTTDGGVDPQTIGDLDQDGQIGFSDFLILSKNFGKSPATIGDGDINGNNAVDFADCLILSVTF